MKLVVCEMFHLQKEKVYIVFVSEHWHIIHIVFLNFCLQT